MKHIGMIFTAFVVSLLYCVPFYPFAYLLMDKLINHPEKTWLLCLGVAVLNSIDEYDTLRYYDKQVTSAEHTNLSAGREAD